MEKIRNFSIIAHIDHGKSTLADRLIELTGSVEKRNMTSQVLDNMDIEKERGITVKSQAVRMEYVADDGEKYILNLIDTPGHVDFNYEVSRSLAACEGALLVVDSTQGVEAQTLANVYLAMDNNLEIIPIINKVDLPNSQVEEVKSEIEEILGLDCSDAPCISAKTGLNCDEVLRQIVKKIPAPKGDENKELKALVFDSKYDNYKGVISYVRVFDGKVNLGDEIQFMATGKTYTVSSIGFLEPGEYREEKGLIAGEVGYIAASIKDAEEVRVGDTITLALNLAKEPLKGYKKAISMVYCGIYPIDGKQYTYLKDSLAKLKLNDAAFNFEPETSKALGFGFRCGFLGLLHLEVIMERIEDEYGVEVITTAPSVIYQVIKRNGETLTLYNPTDLPPVEEIDKIKEPIMNVEILIPKDFVGNVMEVCQTRRGIYKNME